MRLRAFQFFLFAVAAFFISAPVVPGAISSGAKYSLSFVDINGNQLSTADGHITVLVLTTTPDWEKARAVGERVPDFCLGNPNYRMITVIDFISKHIELGRRVITAVIRHRVNEEAKRLQARYDAHKISRDARQDIFTVTDFDGSVSSHLQGEAAAGNFHVLVFARDGTLLAQWTDVPSAKQLAAVLKQSD